MMFALLSNLHPIFAKMSEEWDELMWQCSPERQEMATMRLAAHEKAMKEGYQSPYTHPDDYKMDWTPILKRGTINKE